MNKLAGLAIAVAALCLSGVAGCQSSEKGDDDGVADEESGGTGDETGENADAPTWHQDIAPLVHEKCVGCHATDGIGPFSLASYTSASPWAELMATAVEQRYMPPFLAQDTDDCEPRFGWKEDLRLSDEQITMMREWADAGAPEGDPDAAAELPMPPSLELKDADLRLTIPKPVEIEGPKDDFFCFSLDPQLEEDAWLDAMQIVPGNDKVVHHVLIYLDESGASEGMVNEDGYYNCFGGPGVSGASLLGAWAPGATPITTPDNLAMHVPAGSRLIMNVHYHPSADGVETDPDTAIDLKWFEGFPQWAGQLQLIGNGIGLQPGPNDENGVEFRIPAGATDHTETMIYSLPFDTPDFTVWSVGTHMHYVGTDMFMGVFYQEPEDGLEAECLLQTPDWDFNWQRGYAYDAPLDELPVLRAGDQLYMQCTYDNSMNNPFVVEALEEQGLDAPVDVYLGEETLDEMCLGVFGVAVKLFP